MNQINPLKHLRWRVFKIIVIAIIIIIVVVVVIIIIIRKIFFEVITFSHFPISFEDVLMTLERPKIITLNSSWRGLGDFARFAGMLHKNVYACFTVKQENIYFEFCYEGCSAMPQSCSSSFQQPKFSNLRGNVCFNVMKKILY